jgi:hypothetical protein
MTQEAASYMVARKQRKTKRKGWGPNIPFKDMPFYDQKTSNLPLLLKGATTSQ